MRPSASRGTVILSGFNLFDSVCGKQQRWGAPRELEGSVIGEHTYRRYRQNVPVGDSPSGSITLTLGLAVEVCLVRILLRLCAWPPEQ